MSSHYLKNSCFQIGTSFPGLQRATGGFCGNASLLQDAIRGTYQTWCFIISCHHSGAPVAAAMLLGSWEEITHMCVSMSGFVQTHTQYHSKGKSTEGPVKAQMTLQDYQALSAMPLLMYLACFLLSVCLHLVSKELRFFLPSYSLEASHSAAISIADP